MKGARNGSPGERYDIFVVLLPGSCMCIEACQRYQKHDPQERRSLLAFVYDIMVSSMHNLPGRRCSDLGGL